MLVCGAEYALHPLSTVSCMCNYLRIVIVQDHWKLSLTEECKCSHAITHLSKDSRGRPSASVICLTMCAAASPVHQVVGVGPEIWVTFRNGLHPGTCLSRAALCSCATSSENERAWHAGAARLPSRQQL
jgi:hypothetical protein